MTSTLMPYFLKEGECKIYSSFFVHIFLFNTYKKVLYAKG